ncbi:3-oxoacyl-(acyl-carrier-protein) reductase [Acidobacteriia bacterium SbA2]|nr:3-oxoacyl-(acyl-carrier-protein) reductase [Acidobacteriia bacterium SbA2]
MFELEGKVALVTGSAQGIGRAIALNLAQGGARIVLTDMREPKLDEVVKEIEAQGGKAIRFVVDVTDREAVKKVVDQVLETWEKVDILVNNAGITRDSLVMRMKVEDWQAVLKTNLDGTFYCIQAVLPGMVRQRYGRIVSIASVVAQAGNVGQANYISSKAGIIGLTKGVAAEVARRNITVNAVAPGFIATPMTENLPPEIKEKMLSIIPIGRMGTDAEIATGVRFLVSEEARYITGHVLNINGGMFMA